MSEIRAIQTSYQGYRFRSRLEARWAVFFDACRLRWSYEGEGFVIPGHGCYLPDFFLPGLDTGLFVEVKPDQYEPSRGEVEMWSAFSKQIGKALLLASGPPAAKPFACATEGAWEASAVLVGDDGAVILRRGASAAEVAHSAPLRAIRAARGARFEHGEGPDTELTNWTLADDLIAGLKQRVNEAIAARDEEAAIEAHAELIEEEVRQWAPWKMQA